jgi:hypothetical protein
VNVGRKSYDSKNPDHAGYPHITAEEWRRWDADNAAWQARRRDCPPDASFTGLFLSIRLVKRPFRIVRAASVRDLPVQPSNGRSDQHQNGADCGNVLQRCQQERRFQSPRHLRLLCGTNRHDMPKKARSDDESDKKESDAGE